MSKKLKVYFRKGQTLYNLKNFPGTAQFIAANWNIIATKNKQLNSNANQRKYVAVMLGVKKIIFENIIKDLKIPFTNEIQFFYETGHTHFLSLVPEKTKEEIEARKKAMDKLTQLPKVKVNWFKLLINKIRKFLNIW